MIVNRVALERQSTVLLLLVLIVLTGLYSYLTLPRESFPDIEIPYVFITTAYEGVAPSDMESLVTVPIERELKGLKNVKQIRSTSSEGLSTVAVEFLPGVNMDDALQRVRDKVNQAKPDLPNDLPADPYIKEIAFSDIPVMRVSLSGPFSLRRLKAIADDITDQIESVKGVLEAELSGGLDREIHVEFDLDRVAAYNVPFSTLVTAVQRSNVNMPGGSMDIGASNFTVRIPEDFKDPAEIFSIVAFVRNGNPVYLRDLAYIRDSYKDPVTRARINGQPSVSLAVMKRTGENIIEVSDSVRAVIEDMRPILPPTLKIDITSDMADEIRLLVSDLENNILSGLLLVLVVIFIFIGGRSAIMISLAIPFSMLITFAMLSGLGVSLNMVVLFSLILALGMLVDNAIVIVENIYRHMQEGEPRGEAALNATNEVAWPVITSTLTTLGAFFPLLFFPGIMGEFMKYLPITLILALSASLFVALVINPVLSARFQSVRSTVHADFTDRPALVIRMYLWLLRRALKHRLITVALAFIILILAIFAYGRFGKGTEFFPTIEPSGGYVYLKAPVGTSLDASDELVKQVEKVVSEYKDIKYVIANVGSEGSNPFSQGGSGTHINRVVMDFKDFYDRSRPSSGIITELRQRITGMISGAEVQVREEEHGPPTGAAFNLELYGSDIERLGVLAREVKKFVEHVPGLVDLRDTFVEGRPELRIRVDKEKAALLGLDTMTIAYIVKAAVNGVKVGTFRQGQDEYDIMARLPEKDRQSIESLKRITISGPRGEPIPLTSVAGITMTSGLGAVNHLDQKRVVTVEGDTSGRLSNDVIKDAKARLAKFPWPVGYSYAFTGEQEEQQETMAFLIKAFVAAIFIIFLILVSQFNSLITPFIVLTSVILSLIGVFLGLIITGKPFSITMTGVGVISLAGVVVNNAIVLIDYYNQLLKRGFNVQEALERAGAVRFRPVMLTAITTILGLLPMAVGVSINFRKFELVLGGESVEMWSSMATAVIFGLSVATLLTLIVVPTLCSLAASVQRRRAEREIA